MDDEIWRPCAHDPRYRVSNYGRVRGYKFADPDRTLTATPCRLKPGGPIMGLRVGRKSLKIHRLVLEAFVGPCPPGMEGCHNNGDPQDNRLENLRWDTHKENFLDSIRHGTHVNCQKRGMSLDKIRCIKAEPDFKGVAEMLAKAFNCSVGHIRNVRTGKKWGHIHA